MTVLCAGGTRLARTEAERRPTPQMNNQASQGASYLIFVVLVQVYAGNLYRRGYGKEDGADRKENGKEKEV